MRFYYNLVSVILLGIVSIIFPQGNGTLNKNLEKELNALVENPSVSKALSFIDKIDEVTIQELITLTEIPAPPFKEEKRAQKFKELLTIAGVDKIWIDDVGNVIALRKGKTGKKTVALDAHLDTVFPEGTDVKVKHSGDTLKAPGIGDNTRGLTMVIAVLKAINKAKIKTDADVLFIGTVGEEGLGDLRGVRHLFKQNNLHIDSWISIDGGDIGRVNNQALGSKRYKIIFHGKGGHSWGAFGLANPHHALGKAINYFSIDAAKFIEEAPKTSFNVGRIGGGTSINSIPFESWMEVDMRSVTPESLGEIESILISSVNRALEDYNSTNVKAKLTVDIEKIGDRPSGKISKESNLVQRAMLVTKYFGADPYLTIGSTNASIPISMGIPAITIGRGGKGGNAHSLHEWYLNEKGSDSIKLALLLTLIEAGISN